VLTNLCQITEIRDAEDCYFTQEETAACVDEAHRYKKRVCSHARARDSVQQSIDFGVDVIYHASYIDEKGGPLASIPIDYSQLTMIGMDALERNKSKHVVAPAINWLIATLQDAVMFGYSTEKAEQVGYQKELTAAERAMREMHRRGIVVLPGG
jgi:imidazolonepropionase-like amidohydrolase